MSDPPTDGDIAAALARAEQVVRRRLRHAAWVRALPVSAATAWDWAEPDGWMYVGGIEVSSMWIAWG